MTKEETNPNPQCQSTLTHGIRESHSLFDTCMVSLSERLRQKLWGSNLWLKSWIINASNINCDIEIIEVNSNCAFGSKYVPSLQRNYEILTTQSQLSNLPNDLEKKFSESSKSLLNRNQKNFFPSYEAVDDSARINRTQWNSAKNEKIVKIFPLFPITHRARSLSEQHRETLPAEPFVYNF